MFSIITSYLITDFTIFACEYESRIYTITIDERWNFENPLISIENCQKSELENMYIMAEKLYMYIYIETEESLI